MDLYCRYTIFCTLQILILHFSEGRILRTGCSISVNEDLTSPQPLLLLQNKATRDIKAFPLPQDNVGTIHFNTGETIDVACPGGSILVDKYNTRKNVSPAECSSGDQFRIEERTVAFKSITCNTVPTHIARYTNQKCSGDFAEIEIGFNITNRFIRHISSCFDKDLQHTLYSISTLSSSIEGFQKSFPRPDFIMGNFYNVKPDTVNDLYKREPQRLAINKILGLAPNDTSVISEKGDYFLSRGHYTPKVDYIFGAQQRLTFYYVNVAPQWQISNAGNWNTLEENCRTLAVKRNFDLVVYTGTFGVTTLPDKNGKHQELYLWNNGAKKGIPVPQLMFKVIVEPKSKAGVAFVSVNNPYNSITNKDIICKDVCDDIKWLTWDRFNVKKGYSYCCEIDDFRKSVTFLPQLKVTQLLT